MRFGEWLSGQLEQRGLTPSAFGRLIGRDQSLVSRWVRNESVPNPRSCHQIAEALGVEPQLLLQMVGYLAPQEHAENEELDLQREELKQEMDSAIAYFESLLTRLRSQRSVLGGSQNQPESVGNVTQEVRDEAQNRQQREAGRVLEGALVGAR